MTSRVANNPVVVPSGVDVTIEGQLLKVKGPKGELERVNHDLVTFELTDNVLSFAPANDKKTANALAGTSRALAANMVQGVSEGFERKLTMVGVGYRAKAQGKNIEINVGYSHPVNLEMPEGLTVETPTQTEIVIKGIDKQRVCQMAANIRKIRAPEPYKGKGIRYSDEVVVKKEAKKK
ncbi:MAG: 50S ribosomal protein L6 [Coxiellaceae bacterium]|nr:50S ribosomal protein L6 [Coxiellaceae bacterium]MDF1761704.1 50S ribosomal protein L6 [Coxiellaceae bacterium]